MKTHSKSLIFKTLCCFLFFGPFAQKKELKTKFGKISDEEMNMTAYEEDPEASELSC